MKRNRKLMSILLTLSLLVTLLVPMVGPASAAGNIQALSVPTVVDANGQQLGTIKVTVAAGSIENGDSVIFKITGGYDFGTAFSPNTNNASVVNGVYVPATINADGDANGISSANIAINVIDANDEVQITASANQSLTNDFIFYIYMKDVNVEEGQTDDNVVTFSGPNNTGFAKGTVTNAKVLSDGEVELAVSGDDTSNNNFDFDLRVEESIAGSLTADNKSLKLKLPNGFEWTTTPGTYNNVSGVSTLWGENVALVIAVDAEELTVDFDGPETTAASAWDIEGIFAFTVADDSVVKAGDVKVKVSGETNANVTELVVGTYGDFGANVLAKDTPTILSGKDEQEIGNIVIKEDLGRTLVEDRTVTLTLPAGARWQQVYVADLADDDTPEGLPNFDSDEGLDLNFSTFTGTDDRTAKFTVANESGDAAEITLEDIEVAVEAGFAGDLVVTVAGSAGLSDEVVVAKVVQPVTAKVESTPDVIIGLSGQTGANFTLTEAVLEALTDGESVVLDLPAGSWFTKTPKVEVTSGDLKIGNVRRTGSDNSVTFDIEGESTEPSTISVSDVSLKLDRTVAEGDLTLKVQGQAVAETADYSDWVNSDTAAKIAVAKVVTPAPASVKFTTVFTIASMNYTVNGAEKTMDVAPYIKADRTYLPIRYAAYAAGVADANIIWNGDDQSVLLIKGDRVVKMTIGSNVMYINGVAFTMDVAPEVVDPGRTMLPIRWVAQALGSEVAWDAATQTVTVK